MTTTTLRWLAFAAYIFLKLSMSSCDLHSKSQGYNKAINSAVILLQSYQAVSQAKVWHVVETCWFDKAHSCYHYLYMTTLQWREPPFLVFFLWCKTEMMAFLSLKTYFIQIWYDYTHCWAEQVGTIYSDLDFHSRSEAQESQHFFNYLFCMGDSCKEMWWHSDYDAFQYLLLFNLLNLRAMQVTESWQSLNLSAFCFSKRSFSFSEMWYTVGTCWFGEAHSHLISHEYCSKEKTFIAPPPPPPSCVCVCVCVAGCLLTSL